jgi:flagellin
MSLNISTNTAALRAGAYLSKNNALLQRSMERLASGKKVSTPVDDPGGLAVGMKLSSSINRLAGAQNNVQNAISFLEVQDGMLDTAGQIIDRMSALKGLASADPMKSDADRESYNNEFKDLQAQLYNISQQKFNGVSMFAEFTTDNTTGSNTGTSAVFGGTGQEADEDNTMNIYTSTSGSAGSKVSLHKALLLSALTFHTNLQAGSSGYDQKANGSQTGSETGKFVATLATNAGGTFLDLDDISVGVITQALENISFLRAQNGGSHSRLTFNAEALEQQKTNMQAALGRVVDVDIALESTNLAKYSILNQAAASMLAQANASTDIALMLLR